MKIVLALFGKTKKCLVLDLDNTEIASDEEEEIVYEGEEEPETEDEE